MGPKEPVDLSALASPNPTASPEPGEPAEPGEPDQSDGGAEAADPSGKIEWEKLVAEAELAKPTDLKVLPKTWSGREVVAYMTKVVNPALGVRCGFCHGSGKFAADSKHKTIAREMIIMTEGINQSTFGGKPEVTCMTCHRGEKEP